MGYQISWLNLLTNATEYDDTNSDTDSNTDLSPSILSLSDESVVEVLPSPLLSLEDQHIVAIFQDCFDLDELVGLSMTCKRLYQVIQPILVQNHSVHIQAISRALQNNMLSNFILRFPEKLMDPIILELGLGSSNTRIYFKDVSMILEKFPNATELVIYDTEILPENTPEEEIGNLCKQVAAFGLDTTNTPNSSIRKLQLEGSLISLASAKFIAPLLPSLEELKFKDCVIPCELLLQFPQIKKLEILGSCILQLDHVLARQNQFLPCLEELFLVDNEYLFSFENFKNLLGIFPNATNLWIHDKGVSLRNMSQGNMSQENCSQVQFEEEFNQEVDLEEKLKNTMNSSIRDLYLEGKQISLDLVKLIKPFLRSVEELTFKECIIPHRLLLEFPLIKKLTINNGCLLSLDPELFRQNQFLHFLEELHLNHAGNALEKMVKISPKLKRLFVLERDVLYLDDVCSYFESLEELKLSTGTIFYLPKAGEYLKNLKKLEIACTHLPIKFLSIDCLQNLEELALNFDNKFFFRLNKVGQIGELATILRSLPLLKKFKLHSFQEEIDACRAILESRSNHVEFSYKVRT